MSVASLIKLLIAVAMFAMPLGMVSSASASVSGATAGTMSNCDQMPRKGNQTDRLSDCQTAYAAIVAELEGIPLQAIAHSEPRVRGLATILNGLDPEAATPPPRYS